MRRDGRLLFQLIPSPQPSEAALGGRPCCVRVNMSVHRQIGSPSLCCLNYDSASPRATALPEQAKSTQIGLSGTSGCTAGPPGIQNEAADSFPRPTSPTKNRSPSAGGNQVNAEEKLHKDLHGAPVLFRLLLTSRIRSGRRRLGGEQKGKVYRPVLDPWGAKSMALL